VIPVKFLHFKQALRGCSVGGILEEFGWFEGILKEFVREKYYFG